MSLTPEAQHQLEALIAEWRSKALAAGQCSVETEGVDSERADEEAIIYAKCAMELEQVLRAASLAPSEGIERELRMEWWLNHGSNCCPYGDDGEMQCCMHDFKRERLDRLRAFTKESRIKRLGEMLRPDPAVPAKEAQ